MPKNSTRQTLGGGTQERQDIRGARRDAERLLITKGPQKTKQMLQKEYGYSQQAANRLINKIRE